MCNTENSHKPRELDSLIRRVACESTCPYVRRTAIELLRARNDPRLNRLLMWIAIEDPDASNRTYASRVLERA